MKTTLSERGQSLIEEALVYFFDLDDRKGAFAIIEAVVEHELELKLLEIGPAQERTNKRKQAPKDFSPQEHEARIQRIFKSGSSIDRSRLIKVLSVAYGVGRNKIEMRGGFLGYLTGLGLLEKSFDGKYLPGKLKVAPRVAKVKAEAQKGPEAAPATIQEVEGRKGFQGDGTFIEFDPSKP